MTFDELCNRYGPHLAARLQEELDSAELGLLRGADLLSWLENRVTVAHREYRARLENPFINEELGSARDEYIGVLYRRWQNAEELAYLITTAEEATGRTLWVQGN
jgi:hypothetical protein